MRTRAMSRRTVLEAGVCAMAATAAIPGAAGAHAETSIDMLLADNFTFKSANNDDHIGKSSFKARYWESQIDFIERFELERVIGNGNEAFVMYVCQTKNAKTFRNVEYFWLSDQKVEAIECYFGAPSSFPSAASTG